MDSVIVAFRRDLAMISRTGGCLSGRLEMMKCFQIRSNLRNDKSATGDRNILKSHFFHQHSGIADTFTVKISNLFDSRFSGLALEQISQIHECLVYCSRSTSQHTGNNRELSLLAEQHVSMQPRSNVMEASQFMFQKCNISAHLLDGILCSFSNHICFSKHYFPSLSID